MIEITDTIIDVAAVEAAVGGPGAGAVVTFMGTTRDSNRGRRVISLEYEVYAEMAVEQLTGIADDIRSRWPGSAVAMVHRNGKVEIGEASVVIAVSTPHRVEAFEACRYAIDQLKHVAPIWKKETFEGGEVWIGSLADCDHGDDDHADDRD
ncbi:MAG TPA: molybdenum cofactor biosynthesis protein MoaE [Deltaproteobacteria bacterium]|nr:molybdenum cofactor biosynthesis protein MoaE [Candidatus Binatota bacterium]HIL13003.1 molybdenum cofactor biosynthesis protein MoaE [Deltaproteobacteria bacterium]